MPDALNTVEFIALLALVLALLAWFAQKLLGRLVGVIDGLMCFWQVITNPSHSLKGHTTTASVFTFSPNGRWLVTADEQEMKLWEVASRREICTLDDTDDVTDVVFSRDSHWLVLVERLNKKVKLYETPACDKLLTFANHPYWVKAAAVSSEELLLATAWGDKEPIIKIWGIATGDDVRILRPSAEVGDLAFSPNNHILVSGNADNTVEVWDTSTGHKLGVLDHSDPDDALVAFFREHRNESLSPRQVAVLYQLLRARGRPLDKSTMDWIEEYGDDGLDAVQVANTARSLYPYSIHALTFSPCGQLLAVATGSKVKLWDISQGKVMRTLNQPYPGFVDDLNFSADGRWLATGDYFKKQAKVWDVSSGDELIAVNGLWEIGEAFTRASAPVAVAFSPKGNLLFSHGYNKVVKLWDVAVR